MQKIKIVNINNTDFKVYLINEDIEKELYQLYIHNNIIKGIILDNFKQYLFSYTFKEMIKYNINDVIVSAKKLNKNSHNLIYSFTFSNKKIKSFKY